jgi:hypothetical protein
MSTHRILFLTAEVIMDANRQTPETPSVIEPEDDHVFGVSEEIAARIIHRTIELIGGAAALRLCTVTCITT